MEKEAQLNIKLSQFALAHAQFTKILAQQPENDSIRFWCAYSLFMTNKLDRSKYGYLQQQIQILHRNGYQHPNLTEMQEFLVSELSAFQ